MPYFVYLAECRDGSYYCGIAKNLAERTRAHNEGRGARYTRSRRPVRIVYSEERGTLGSALSREMEIKGYTRGRKAGLIGSRTKN